MAFDIEAVRTHVRTTKHKVAFVFAADGKGAFYCQSCETSWLTCYEELAGIKDALMDQPGSLERLANYINAAKNPTVWDRLGEEDA